MKQIASVRTGVCPYEAAPSAWHVSARRALPLDTAVSDWQQIMLNRFEAASKLSWP